MASAIDTANPDLKGGRRASAAAPRSQTSHRPDGRRRGWALGSRLGRTIIALNLLGLAILVGGALVLNDSRQGVIQARLESLTVQGELIANVIDQTATVGEPTPALAADTASGVLQSLFIPRSQRARLFDASQRLLADSEVVADRVDKSPLPPIRRESRPLFDLGLPAISPAKRTEAARLALNREVAGAMGGATISDLRMNEHGRRVVSVSIPIRHVRAVLGVLTLEAADIDTIIAAERAALVPYILIAIGVALLSSLLLIQNIAVPVLRLARAADRVRLARTRAISLPDLAGRDDEIGDLTRSLEAMTTALSERMVAIERFAADVSHELRNPMTSIRSAVETLDLVKTDAQRQRLVGILHHDVGRLDRLITDISNASRLDAELARNTPAPMDLARLLADICEFYSATGRPGEAPVIFSGPAASEPVMVSGREGPLGQVFRNLVDNARSFSPPGAAVRVTVSGDREEVLVRVEDDGPGVPPENLETVFERFYTSRPKGAAFGHNSGLGLSIARQIVEAHDGRIWAENRTDASGARFSVEFPEARAHRRDDGHG
jgi:two-component system sensor histidine kinase ChvG